MPTIQMNDPFATGVNAANSWAEGQNDAKAKALELAHRKQQDDQAQSNSDRSFTLEKDTATQTQNRANNQQQHDFARDSAADLLAKHQQSQADQLFPLLKKKAQLENAAAGDATKMRAVQLADAKVQLQLRSIDAKFGPQMAQAALAKAQADVSHEQAATVHENAATAHENAETGLTEQYSRNLSQGLTKTGKAVGAGKETFESGFEKLSPAGQQAWNAVSSSNNKATPGQLLAVIGKSPLPDADKRIMRLMMATKTGATTATRTDASAASAAASVARQDASRAGDGMSTQERVNTAMKATSTFPAKAQAAIIGLAHKGVSAQAILQMIDDPASGATDEQKAAAHAVYGATPTSGSAQPSGGGPDYASMLRAALGALRGAGQNAGASQAGP